MKKKSKIIILAALGTALLLLTALALAGNYLVNFAIVRKDAGSADVAPESIVTPENRARMEENLKRITRQTEQWLSSAEMETVQIESFDKLTLKADLFHGDNSSHDWLIAVHGYTGKRQDMQNVAAYYGVRGYHVLTPDMRSHGESEGKYIGMGWPDRKDILQWISYITQRDPEARIILHGISMGGATVMMTSGEMLPPQVKGVVEDCGYTSVWDIFSDELDYVFNLPEFPLLYAADAIAYMRAGYEFKTASALEQVKKSSVPILFIHGSEDNFVQAGMVNELYEACQAPKELLIVEGAGHGDSYRMDPELYFDTVFRFIEDYCRD